MFRLDKRKIFLLYRYYLLGNIQKTESKDEKEKKKIIWFNDCLAQEKLLGEKITKNLKTGWEFSRFPPLERAILIYATYELLLGKNTDLAKMIIDQTINFSKVYLAEGKYKYINKVLDLTIKDSKIENIVK